MNHLTRDAELLAVQLAEARGISPGEAIIAALYETLERTSAAKRKKPPLEGQALIQRLEQISERAGALPVLDPRSVDEILGYDEFGLPT